MDTTPLPPRNPIRAEAQARAILGPHLAKLIAAIRHGFEQWDRLAAIDMDPANAGRAPLRAPLDARARASFIYRHTVAEARRLLHGIPGVLLADNRNFLTVHFGDEFIVRFKKLDRRGRSRNFPTQTQKLFALQAQMFGLGTATRTTVGYQLDELEKSIHDIRVVCPNGNQTAWNWSALEAVGAAAPAATTPIVPIAPVGETTIVVDPSKARRAPEARDGIA
jgi:hypothetical protein